CPIEFMTVPPCEALAMGTFAGRCGLRAAIPVADLLEHAAPLDDVLVVPLDGPRLAEPALQIALLDLRCIGDANLRGLELALRLQARLVEGLAAPEEQLHIGLPHSLPHPVTDDGVPVDEPHGRSVPNLALGPYEHRVDRLGEGAADLARARR